MKAIAFFVALFLSPTEGFTTPIVAKTITTSKSHLSMTDDVKAAPMVSGEELEMMLTEWDLPLVVDAYATW